MTKLVPGSWKDSNKWDWIFEYLWIWTTVYQNGSHYGTTIQFCSNFPHKYICSANQWTGFYMITASVMKGLTFSWIQPQMLLRCCLIHITIIILSNILYLVYLWPCLGQVLFILYLCHIYVICFSFSSSFSLWFIE